jgi:RsiW-degrading membrane proteinase PrsW (M82 family)
MPAILIFPAATYALLLVVYIRAFSRATGLRVRIISAGLYSVAGASATLLAYILLSALRELTKDIAFDSGLIVSPLIEELIKLAVLHIMAGRMLLASEPLQRFRQRILSGLIIGMAFGLVETYLYLFTNIQLLTGSMILGSIPLHMVTGGYLGYLSAIRRPKITKSVLLLVIIGFHQGYNQIVQLPPPLSYLSFLLLLAGAIALLNLLTNPRDYTKD